MPPYQAARTQSPRSINSAGRPARRRGRSGASSPAQGASTPARGASGAAASRLDAALATAQLRPHADAATFAELGVPDSVVRALAESDITRPSSIQSRALPDALAGRDVLGRAQTGSGKTLAFGVPMVVALSRSATGAHGPRGLVLVPTRELAHQVADALAPLARTLGLRTATLIGGTSITRQISDLRARVDVVVATPGRLVDLLDRRAISLGQIEVVALDEADHMADLGFLPSVTRILDATPPTRQSLLFSATLDRGVDRLAERYLSDPALHAVSSVGATVDTMDHHVFRLRREDKVTIAAEIAARPARTLFFVRTKHGADRLARQLRTRGVEAGALHGNLNQNQRTRALESFATGRARVLVATDVAARGIHVDDVDLVVHYDPPNDHKDYLHRSGRTARAGATGAVIAFVEPEQQQDVARMHAAAQVRPQVADVHAGHPAVRSMATSGTPIDVAPMPAQPASSSRTGSTAPANRRRNPGGRRHSGRGRRAAA